MPLSGVESDKEAAEDSDSDGEDADVRDRGKSRRYKKLLNAKAIPEHIQEMIEEQSKKETQPRKFKTMLINKLFEKNSKGQYDMVANQPVFESYKEATHKRYGSEETRGKPRSVFLYDTFHGNAEALQAAIEEGAVLTWNQDGIAFCGFKGTTAGVEKSTSATSKLATGKTDLEKKEYATLSKAFGSMGWEFGGGSNEKTSTASGSGGQPTAKTGLKQLENVELTPAMQELLTDAKSANQRLETNCVKLLARPSVRMKLKKRNSRALSWS